MRALGYIRVSTAEQAATGHSLDGQRERISAWCVARGLELVGLVCDEGVSAGKALEKRKGGAELLQRMAAGEADVVVVMSIDRMFRNAQDGLNTLLGVGGQGGLALQSVTDPCDTTTAMGRFILTIWLARAQLEREQTCERNQAISIALRQQGRPNGNTPYGCRLHAGLQYRCPELWPVRERVVQLRHDGVSFAAIAEQLRADGIRAPGGGANWSKSALSRLVTSHGSLIHLPLWNQSGSDAAAAPEAQVSAPTPENASC